MSDTDDIESLREELEKCRAMLLQSAKLAELGQQLAQIVHEMNQPLMGIKAFAQMLRKDLEGQEGFQRRAGFIEEQAAVLERLTARVRRYSRMAHEPGGQVDPREVVEKVLELMSYRLRRAGTQVDVELDAGLPDVNIGDLHAQQLIVNLLGNAMDAVDGLEHRQIRILGRLHGEERVQLVVADSGPGVPPDARDRLFEPFFTTKDEERGTGLGLPICKEIVKAYGGSLELRSDADASEVGGEGMRTAFVVDLPKHSSRAGGREGKD